MAELAEILRRQLSGQLGNARFSRIKGGAGPSLAISEINMHPEQAPMVERLIGLALEGHFGGRICRVKVHGKRRSAMVEIDEEAAKAAIKRENMRAARHREQAKEISRAMAGEHKG
jgi:hypothetical protein